MANLHKSPAGPPTNNPKTVPAMAAAIIGLVGSLIFPIVGLVLGGVGLFFGSAALREIDASNGAQDGRTMAKAATIVGAVAMAFAVAIVIWAVSTGHR